MSERWSENTRWGGPFPPLLLVTHFCDSVLVTQLSSIHWACLQLTVLCYSKDSSDKVYSILSDLPDAGYINTRHYHLPCVKEHLDAGKGGWGS